MNGKKIGEKIAIAIALILAVCVLALAVAGTVKLILWMF